MKLALIFLLAFVTASYQQRFQNRMQWMPKQMISPYQRGLFYDDLYNNINYNYYPLGRRQELDDDDEDRDAVEIINPSSAIPSFDHENDGEDDRSVPAFQNHLLYRSSPMHSSPYLMFYDYINNYNNNRRKYNNNNNHPFFRNNHQQYLNNNDYGLADQIEARGRFPSREVATAVDPRSFFGSINEIYFSTSTSNTRNRLFGKTRGVIVTSTVNITSVVSCVVSTEFVVGAAAPACRRRRRGMEHLLAFDDLAGSPYLSPSQVEKVETTLAPDSAMSFKQRNEKLSELLASSKDELIIEDDDDNNRVKRSFFYVTTTTLTAYTFFTTSVIKTVKLLTAATTSALTCLPSGFTFC